ncbi:MAG TPA: GPP34 family phosphoprotein [Gaiellaceae bacterium]|nr:GPP34 family phosphoprotein [Gaiellaceae bacterium]
MSNRRTLIAEDLLLLLTDDRSGRLLAPSDDVDVALGGALLLELALARRVNVAGEGSRVREGRLFVTDDGPAGDPLLDEALAAVGAKEGKRPSDVVAGLGKGLRARLQARLAEQGLLRAETVKILGVVPSQRWPSEDSSHEDSLRAELVEALRAGRAADPRLAALVSLLHALKAVTKVFDAAEVGVTSKELKAAAKQIADGDWASKAVREAIDAMLVAVIAATSVTSVAAR